MRTLVLNAGYEPLAVVSFKRALVLVLEGKASLLACDEGNPVLSASGEWERPSVILLRRYVRIPSGRHVPVSRRGVLRRDSQRCAYCAATASTIDHVIPRSRGGADSWENLVPCCLALQQPEGRPHPARDGLESAADPAPAARNGVVGARCRAPATAVERVLGARGMSTVWQVPVATRAERGAGLSRRLLRDPEPPSMPRDARPSRARRERVPAPMRAWGPASRIRP